jgi:thymidylate synthase (FAD)
MNIIKPYAKILNINNVGENYETRAFNIQDGIALLKKIEWCGRISHRSEDKKTSDSWNRFIRSVVLEHGDWSIVEHAILSCDFYVDRGITHEIVRHRLFSFTQESTRFVNYEKKMPASFVEPSFNVSDKTDPSDPGCEQSFIWRNAISFLEGAYKSLIEAGCKPQIARSVFPNALASRIIITGNLRNWRHFFLMRTSKEAHPQMKEVTIPLLKQFQECIPIIYEDIVPESRQIDNLKLGR